MLPDILAASMYMVALPLFVLSSRLFAEDSERFVVRYREIIILTCTNILFPARVYSKNEDLRNHVKERIRAELTHNH